MSITYPLSFSTDWPIMTTSFTLRYRQFFSRNGDGKLNAVDLGYPVWVGSFQTAIMSHAECVEFEALLNSLGGAQQMMLIGDSRREYPAAYPTGAPDPFGAVATINVDGVQLSLSGLAAGQIITRGDYLSMLFGGRRYLLQAVETVTADGSGVTGDFQTSPPPPAGLTVGEVIALNRPTCRMRLEPGSVSFSDNMDGTGTVSFSGVQV